MYLIYFELLRRKYQHSGSKLDIYEIDPIRFRDVAL